MRITPEQAQRLTKLAIRLDKSFFAVSEIALELGLKAMEDENGQISEMQLPIGRHKDFQTIGEIND